tara:strand:- start:7113 stop:8432 length:1320 start_codon:yes stop_codon:yes gene_type:complete
MAIVYEKSDLGIFLEQLPQLLMQYYSAQGEREREAAERKAVQERFDAKLQHEKDLIEDRNELEANLLHYKDMKDEYRDNERLLEELTNTYLASGAEIEDLNELFRTNESLKVLENLSTIQADDYAKKAEYYSDKADNAEIKIEQLKEVIYGDILKAKQLIQGGDPEAGYTGGDDPEAWDIGDIDYNVYKSLYGENPIIENLYKNVPGELTKSLNILEAGRVSKEYDEARTESWKSKKTDETVDEKEDKSRLYVMTRVNNAYRESGLQGFDTHALVVKAPEGEYTADSVEYSQQKQVEIQEGIAYAISRIRDEVFPIDPIERSEYVSKVFQEYISAHEASVPVYNQGTGLISDSDFTYFEGFIEDAWDTYKDKDPDARKELDEITQRLFGYTRMTFEEFVSEYRSFRTDLILGPLAKSNQNILDETDNNNNEFDWEFHLK